MVDLSINMKVVDLSIQNGDFSIVVAVDSRVVELNHSFVVSHSVEKYNMHVVNDYHPLLLIHHAFLEAKIIKIRFAI